MNYLITARSFKELRSQNVNCYKIFYKESKKTEVDVNSSSETCGEAFEKFMRQYEMLRENAINNIKRDEKFIVGICDTRASRKPGGWQITGKLIAILEPQS